MIPKKVHYCWLSGDPFPALVENCIASWHKNLPDYEFILWDYAKIETIINPWLKECIGHKKYAFAADYIRLYALYTEGGIYLDSDVEVLKSFDDLLDQPSFIGTEISGDLEAAVIGSVSGTVWLKRCLDYYTNHHFIKKDGTLNTKPLPSIMGEILSREYNLDFNSSYIKKNDKISLVVYPSCFFSPKSLHSSKISITNQTYSIHHFDGSWIQKNNIYFIKYFIHSTIIFFLGKRLHNSIIQKLFR